MLLVLMYLGRSPRREEGTTGESGPAKKGPASEPGSMRVMRL
ncbi:MAG TPA: hypothetical protein VD997_01900 [Phycisphaerales bacterium]|nr:hypothetical protein [Phycisphaerales bacterium]